MFLIKYNHIKKIVEERMLLNWIFIVLMIGKRKYIRAIRAELKQLGANTLLYVINASFNSSS